MLHCYDTKIKMIFTWSDTLLQTVSLFWSSPCKFCEEFTSPF